MESAWLTLHEALDLCGGDRKRLVEAMSNKAVEVSLSWNGDVRRMNSREANGELFHMDVPASIIWVKGKNILQEYALIERASLMRWLGRGGVESTPRITEQIKADIVAMVRRGEKVPIKEVLKKHYGVSEYILGLALSAAEGELGRNRSTFMQRGRPKK